MTERCFAVEELAEVHELVAGDPRLQHLETCPRCRARLAEYRRFLAPGPAPADANLGDAERRLADALEREAGARPNAGATLRPATPGGLRALFGAPAWRPALGVAAALLLVSVIYLAVERPFGRGDRVILRGESHPGAKDGFELALPRPGQAGTLDLRWTPVAGADAYEVRIFDAGLTAVARLTPVSGTSVTLRHADLPPGIESHTSLIWRVAALRAGDEIALSSVGTLQAP